MSYNNFSFDELGPLSEGNLSEIPFPAIIHSLSMAGMSGILNFSRGKIEKKIFFKNGFIIFAGSNNYHDYLGSLLVNKNVITMEHLNKASHIFENNDGLIRLGKILVDMGLLAEVELDSFIQMQVLRIIYSLFKWELGNFAFIEDDFPMEEIQLKFTVGDLIMEGIRNLTSERIHALLPSYNKFIRISKDPFILYQNIRLNYDEKKIFESINGNQTIAEIVEIRTFQKIEVEKALCGMIFVRLLEISDEAESELEIPSVIGSELEEIIAYDLSSSDETSFMDDSILLEEKIVNKGKLKDIFLPEYMLGLACQRKTGLLTCNRKLITKTIYFKQGKVIYAQSDSPFDQLISLLQVVGRITEEQAEKAMELWQTRKSEWQGTILMELGFLGFDKLDWPLQFQLKEIVIEMLGWIEGDFSFKEGDLPDSTLIASELPLEEIVIDGLKRHASSPAVVARLPQLNSVFKQKIEINKRYKKIPFSTSVLKLLELLDGSKTLEKAKDFIDLNTNEIQLHVLIFLLLGLIEQSELIQPETVSPASQKEVSIASKTNKLDEKDVLFIDTLKSFYEKFALENDPYLVMELPRNCNENELKAKYHLLINKFHPDKTVGFGNTELTEIAQEIITKINEAFNILNNPETRRLYDGELSISNADEEEITQKAFLYEDNADNLLIKEKYVLAMEDYKQALTYKPQNSDLLAKIAFIVAFYEGNFRDAKKFCRKAIENDPENATVHALMATICRSSGLKIVAEQAIKLAFALDDEDKYAIIEKDFIEQNFKTMTAKDRKKFARLLIDTI